MLEALLGRDSLIAIVFQHRLHEADGCLRCSGLAEHVFEGALENVWELLIF